MTGADVLVINIDAGSAMLSSVLGRYHVSTATGGERSRPAADHPWTAR